MSNRIKIGSGAKPVNRGAATKFPGVKGGRRRGGCSSCRGK